MKLAFSFILIVIGILLLQGCEQKKAYYKKRHINIYQNIKLDYSFQYIDNKREICGYDGSYYNEMTLYVLKRNVNIDSLKIFCKEQKNYINDGNSHVLIFFTDKKHAKFNSRSLTSIYIDKRISPFIKAYYFYNYQTGFSQLLYYKKNSWESIRKEISIN